MKKVIFCSGKIYFDLAAKQQKDSRKDAALVRVEQLYPLPYKQLSALYSKYNKAIWYWVQEEPLNMGAASFLQMNLNTGLRQLGLPEMNYGVISRESSASPATGFSKIHAQEQGEIIETAFSI